MNGKYCARRKWEEATSGNSSMCKLGDVTLSKAQLDLEPFRKDYESTQGVALSPSHFPTQLCWEKSNRLYSVIWSVLLHCRRHPDMEGFFRSFGALVFSCLEPASGTPASPIQWGPHKRVLCRNLDHWTCLWWKCKSNGWSYSSKRFKTDVG